jgi:alpha-tubulin suppressor-like RCC1 family protein
VTAGRFGARLAAAGLLALALVPSAGGAESARPLLVRSLASGAGSYCAVLENGQVHCWGLNLFGSLGVTQRVVGDDEDPVYPANTGTTERAVSVSVSGFHSCVLTQSGEARCFGVNLDGQLGNGRVDFSTEFYEPEPVVSGGARFVSVVAGGFNTCGIDTNGLVRCWGYNGFGVNGLANRQGRTTDALVPTPMPDNEKAVNISVDAGLACAVLESGRVACWGSNDDGQLGLGFRSKVELPTVVVMDRTDAVQVSAAGRSVCVRFSVGTARCWGDNELGQAGLGTRQRVGDDELPAVNVNMPDNPKVVSIAASGVGHCALLEGGRVRCWGQRGYQLGIPRTTEIIGDDEPVTENAVLDTPAVGLLANSTATCALLVTGRVRCWGGGANAQGDLGVPALHRTATITGLDINFGNHPGPTTTTSTTTTQPVPVVPVNEPGPTTTATTSPPFVALPASSSTTTPPTVAASSTPPTTTPPKTTPPKTTVPPSGLPTTSTTVTIPCDPNPITYAPRYLSRLETDVPVIQTAHDTMILCDIPAVVITRDQRTITAALNTRTRQPLRNQSNTQQKPAQPQQPPTRTRTLFLPRTAFGKTTEITISNTGRANTQQGIVQLVQAQPLGDRLLRRITNQPLCTTSQALGPTGWTTRSTLTEAVLRKCSRGVWVQLGSVADP